MKRFAFLFIASCALANDTAIHDGGHGPAPIGDRRGPESVIRMVREHLDISFGAEGDRGARDVCLSQYEDRDAPARQTVGFPDLTAMSADRFLRWRRFYRPNQEPRHARERSRA